MTHDHHTGNNHDPHDHVDAKAALMDLFKTLPNTIEIHLFNSSKKDDVLSRNAKEIIKIFSGLTDKIVFKEYKHSHDLVKKWHIDHFPSMVISPDRYRIQWLGVPGGEEGKAFTETILMIGFERNGLSEQSRKILHRIDTSRQIKVFVSPTCPYCPQQAVNAIKAAIERPDVISVQIIDVQSNPDLAEEYHAHSVPQTYANDILIGSGAQPEELFAQSLEKLEEQSYFIPDVDAELIETDVVIVGGGPAGLTAGIYTVRSGLKTVVIEKEQLGGQIANTPVVENYPGLTQVGGKTLVDLMVSHALEYVQIFQGEKVMGIQPGEMLEVTTNRRRFKTKAVLLATGAANRRLDVPGEKRLSGRGVSYCTTCDGPLFKGKNVVMAGGGDSAVTEALHLHHIGAKVTLVHRRDTLRAQDYLVKNLRNSDIPIRWNTEIKEIRGRERVEEVVLFDNQTKETDTQKVEGVFVAIGYEPATALAGSVGVEITPEGYIKRDDRHRTNIPGIYSAGDVEGGYKQIVTAAGQGAEAAMSIFEDLIHPYWKQK